MALTPELMDRTIDEHFGFEAADNIDGVLGTLAPDAVHDIVGWPPGPTQGRESARAFYEQMFADLAESSVRVVKRLYGENFLVDESIWTGRAAVRSGGRNRSLTFRILHVLEFAPDGQIQRENVWLDMAAIIQQLPQD